MPLENRRYNRLNSDFNVRILYVDEKTGLGDIDTAKSKNVSATGVLISSPTPYSVGSVINAKFMKPNSLDFFEGNARVVRVEIDAEEEGYDIGIQFLDITIADEKKLQYYLSKEE